MKATLMPSGETQPVVAAPAPPRPAPPRPAARAERRPLGPPPPPRPPAPPRPRPVFSFAVGGRHAVEAVGASPFTPPERIAAAPPRPAPNPPVAAAPVRVHWYCDSVHCQREPAASKSIAP